MTRPKAWDAQGYDADFGFVSGSAGGVLEWLAPQPGMRILDLGCGTGELLAELLEAGTDAVGLDADPAMVERAQRRVGADRVRRLDAQSFGLVDAFGLPFDAVFSNAALHWMHRPADVIASVREVLRPGGRFVAEMGAGRNMATIVAALRQARAANGWTGDVATPWYFPTPAEYASLLEGGGLELRRLAYFPRRTLLSESANPIGQWVEMFATEMVDDLPADARAAVLAELPALTRDELFRDGRWYADYWRLRFEAIC